MLLQQTHVSKPNVCCITFGHSWSEIRTKCFEKNCKYQNIQNLLNLFDKTSLVFCKSHWENEKSFPVYLFLKDLPTIVLGIKSGLIFVFLCTSYSKPFLVHVHKSLMYNFLFHRDTNKYVLNTYRSNLFFFFYEGLLFCIIKKK